MTKRRAAALLVLVVGLVLLGRLFSRAPVEVTVVYHLGAAAQGLRELDVQYLRTGDGELARHVTWHYEAAARTGDAGVAAPRAAPVDQEHPTRLPPGEYRVVARLTYADGRTSTRQRHLAIENRGRAFVDLEQP